MDGYERNEMDNLNETSPELAEALRSSTKLPVSTMNTGGGCMVTTIDLGEGREIWLTREERWIVGFYDFHKDNEDEGICVELISIPTRSDNDPLAVASAVAGLIERTR